MRMSQDDIIHIAQNTPIPVEFAGLRGNTMEMQKQGWEIVVELFHCEHMYGYEFGLTGRHRGLDLYFYSGRTMFDMKLVHRGIQGGIIDFMRCLKMPVRIAHCAPNIVISAVGEMPTSQFMSVDFSQPVMHNMKRSNLNLEDLVPFRGYNNVNEILIADDRIITIQSQLDGILAGQMEFQSELREKRRKKQKQSGEPMDFNENPNGEIKLQLVGI